MQPANSISLDGSELRCTIHAQSGLHTFSELGESKATLRGVRNAFRHDSSQTRWATL